MRSSDERYYFALPRLWAFLSGGDARRSEQNAIEAYFGGIAVFVISYAMLLSQFCTGAAVALLLLFVTWIAWLPTFYLNALVVHTLRCAGLFAGVTNARAQNVLIGAETTVCAVALTRHVQWATLGWTWLLIVAANSAAAVTLHFAMPHDA